MRVHDDPPAMNWGFPSKLKSRILEKVKNNKLTIVVGPTGCGKSSIVPQILLDGIGAPILCTQPRRLAVVAVSSHVAAQRGSVLGEEIGYHVGQDRVANRQTGLLFATAGILLEELKGNGLEALTRYKIVIIDECHERSCESDLCLTIIKEFMVAYPRCKLRLILMSATFNHGKYTSFFSGVPGCEYVDTITMQTANSIDMFYSNVQTYYLESIAKMLAGSGCYNDEVATYCTDMKYDPVEELKSNESGKLLSENLLGLIRSLAEYMHNIEPKEKIFLIFTPTYRQLEQIYFHLQEISEFDLGLLHASIDIEDCLQSMKGRNEVVKRKVLLASAIADSSITIPNVSVVIDTCRALEVKWASKRSTYESTTTFASQAICDQRRGRTGRTCSGRVFRLVPESFYHTLEKFEQPQIEMASCRDEALSLLSSKNKVMSSPSTLLRKCLDPPPTDNVADALEYLISIGVCRQIIVSRKRRVILTEHGKLISALPFTVEEAEAISYGARRGLLHEALVLVAIKSLSPKPIVNAFGDGDSNRLNLCRYFAQVDVKDPQSQLVAHFAAYLFWYVNWGSIRRSAMMEHFEHCTNGFNIRSQFFRGDSYDNHYDFGVGSWTPELDKVHSDWCRDHFINPSSVKQISQYVALTMNTLYSPDLSPEWLKCQDPEPVWNSDKRFDIDMQNIFMSVYGTNGREMPYTLVGLQKKALSRRKIQDTSYACIHFLNGSCSYGDDCRNAHSYDAARPPCRFQDRCTNSSCLYSHSNDSENSADLIVDPIYGKFNGGPLMWYRQHAISMLLLDQGCGFQQSLEALRISPAMSLKVPTIVGLHTNSYLQHYSQEIDRVGVNFPRASSNATAEDNERFIRGFFLSAAVYFRSKALGGDSEVGVALRGKEFSRWNVLSSAQGAGFCLQWAEEFDCAMFPRYRPHKSDDDDDEMYGGDAQFYVFRLKQNVRKCRQQMIRLRDEARFGVELEMSTSAFLSPQMIANDLKASGIRILIPNSYGEGKQNSSRWKIVTDNSLACNMSVPNCNVFELVSPILRSEEGISSIKHILHHFPRTRLNRSMGFHVHIDVEKYSVEDLCKIFQQYLKYEAAIDSMMPKSRRTGSNESNSYFKSNLEMAKQELGRSKEGVMVSLSKCRSLRDLAHIVNPTGERYYKLNMQNLIQGRQTTLEFRQHSSTADFDKVSAWVRFCIRLCENAVSLEQSPLFNLEDTSVDKQFDDLFRNLIRDSVLYDFYRKRRQVLSVDDESDACCMDCANGRGRCSK